jgi:polyhydroxybutyrate depolymerase
MSATYQRFAVFGMLALALFAGVACRRLRARVAHASDRNGTLEIGGLTRRYFVHAPPSNDSKPLPLVLVLHGATQSPENVEEMSGMSAAADRENFLAVYPRGTGRLPTWNAGACCGPAMEQRIDDVGFIDALIAKLERDYAVDPKRIFATGISNGGMLSYRLACELSGKIAAIAPVEGAQDLACHPSNPVSVIVFHGTADRLVPFEGGRTPFQVGPHRADTSVASSAAFWAKQDGCSPTPQREESGGAHVETYSGCRDGSGVAVYAIQGGHHIWPGTRFSHNDVPATSLMWSFFAQHPKP